MKGLVANEAGRVARNSAGETSAPVGPVEQPRGTSEVQRPQAGTDSRETRGEKSLLCRKKRGKKLKSILLSVTSGIGTRPSMMTRKPTVGDGAASSGACGHPSAWPALRRLPWPRRFLAKTIRGPAPGAHVLEPLPLTRILGSPTDVSLRSLLSFFVFLYLSVCEASKLRSLPFTHPIYVASRYSQ